MKKLLAVLVVAVLLAGSAFAGVTTVTKEMSQSNYPGVLVPGSMTGLSTFVTDLGLTANVALLEYLDGDAYGFTSLKTDMGVFGLSLSPNDSISVDSISVTQPSNNLILMYATDLEGMTVAGSLAYGLSNSGYENKNLEDNSQDPDKYGYFRQNLGLVAGVALKGDLALDLSLGITLKSQGDSETNNYNNADKRKAEEDKYDASTMAIDLAGRMNLGDGLSAVLGVTLNSGSSKSTSKDYADDSASTVTGDTETTYSGSNLAVNALIGKEIKATSTLTIKMASGLEISTDATSKYLYEDKLASTKTYNTSKWSEMDLYVPMNVAVEGKLNETWSINAGVSSNVVTLWTDETKRNEDTTKEDYKDWDADSDLLVNPNVSYDLGVTGVIGDLCIDLHINPALLLYGPDFINGSGYDLTVGNIALYYKW